MLCSSAKDSKAVVVVDAIERRCHPASRRKGRTWAAGKLAGLAVEMRRSAGCGGNWLLFLATDCACLGKVRCAL
jgi:hypothetical protein